MEKQLVVYNDLGLVNYKEAWDYQESLMQQNVLAKSTNRTLEEKYSQLTTSHYFILCEHPPVYTLGRNGNSKNILISEDQLKAAQIQLHHINRGGDTTFHGPQQLVGYPILDLEKFYTDISRYIYEIEEIIIRTIAEFGIEGIRSKGETGVWLDTDNPEKSRKICAIGIRCSRWVTMHGFALNVNTDLDYFNHIIPCGIPDKKVTSIEREVGYKVDLEVVKLKLCRHFEKVFGALLQTPVNKLSLHY